jgi:hypothetical protein
MRFSSADNLKHLEYLNSRSSPSGTVPNQPNIASSPTAKPIPVTVKYIAFSDPHSPGEEGPSSLE